MTPILNAGGRRADPALYAEGWNALQIAAELHEDLNRTEVAIAAHARRQKKLKEGGEDR